MNNTSNYEEIIKKIENGQNEIDKLILNSKDLKKFFSIMHNIKELKQLKKKIEPFYLEDVMKECTHLFIKTSYKYSEWYESDRYILFVNHYCLKCGCSTKVLDKSYLEKKRVNFIPSFIVDHNKQIEIIENSKNYQIIDCGEISLYELVVLWENIKKRNIKFDEKVMMFLEIISKNIKKDTKKKEGRVYEFKYLD